MSRSTKTLTRFEVACGAAVASARNPAKERPVMVEKCMMLLDMDFAIRLVAVEERYGSIGGLF